MRCTNCTTNSRSAKLSVSSDTLTTMTRLRTTIGRRSDAEILTDFAKMLALRALLDDLHSSHDAQLSESTPESGSARERSHTRR